MNTIIREIYGVDTIDGLRDIQRAVNQRRSELESRSALEFKIGDSVKFGTKCRGTQEGIVKKINRKTVAVLVGGITWRVSPSLLIPVSRGR